MQAANKRDAISAPVSHPRRILFVTLSNIGDAILTTPTLESLHRRFPDALIDIVADERSAIIFRDCPYRGQIFIKKKRSGLAGLFELVSQLRQTTYDLAVDLRTDGLLWLIRAREKVSKKSNRATMHLHSVEKHWDCIRHYVAPLIPATQIWLSSAQKEKARELLPLATRHGRILALGLGANFQGKIWQVTAFAELAKQLTEIHALFDHVMLLGDQRDKALSQLFVQNYGKPVLDFCGRLDILETAAMLQSADYFVGNDSGLGHMASAVGIPTYTVFGVGQPHRYRPWGEHAAWVQSPDRCVGSVEATAVASAIITHLGLIKLD